MQIRVIPTVEALNQTAADHAASALRRILASRDVARIIVATGSSQIGFLDALIVETGIDWDRVELFHLDEYLGLPQEHPASFSRFITDRIIRRTGITRTHLVDGLADADTTMTQLERALAAGPVDLAFCGIGENGHLAFNEPPADFDSPHAFIRVALDEISRRQQVGEGWFARLEDVPTHALTMTVPQILKTKEILCLAHGTRKARAVAACFSGKPTPEAPASALMTHAGATVYLDPAAASLLPASVTG
jgi:glucosamine-6-phosphate deaminase